MYLLSPYVVSLLTGLIFAMTLVPLMAKFPRIRGKEISIKVRAAVLSLGFAAAILAPFGAGLYLGADVGLKQLKRLQSNGGAGVSLVQGSGLQATVKGWLEANPRLDRIAKSLPMSEEELLAGAERGLRVVVAKTTEIIEKLASQIPTSFIQTLIALIALYFVLADGPKFQKSLEHSPFFRAAQNRELMSVFANVSSSVLMAAVASGFLQALILSCTSAILGFGSPVLIGVITFFCSFLPLVGTAPVPVALAIGAAAMGHSTTAILFLVIGFIASLSNNFIFPIVVGRKKQIHPFMAFITAFGGLQMIGIYGIFVGPVLYATLAKMVSFIDEA